MTLAAVQTPAGCSSNADCADDQTCYAAGSAHAHCITKGLLGNSRPQAPELVMSESIMTLAPVQTPAGCSSNADCADDQTCYAAGSAHAHCITKGLLGNSRPQAP